MDASSTALGSPVPAHSGDGVLPPAFHFPEGGLVLVVTAVNHFAEVSVLGLDDLVSGGPLVCEVAGPSELFARHCLHLSDLPSQTVRAMAHGK